MGIPVTGGCVVQTRAALDDSSGKYNNRYFVQYAVSVKQLAPAGTTDLFDSRTGERFSRLIVVDGPACTVKLPLGALSASRDAPITIEDSNMPARLFPYPVSVFKK